MFPAPAGDSLKYAYEKMALFHREAQLRRDARSARWSPGAYEHWTEETRQAVRRTEIVYNLTKALFWVAVGLPLPLAVVFMQARGMDLFQVGLLTSIFAFTVAALELPTGGLADSIGRKRVTLLAYTFLLLKDLVFLIAFSFPMFIVSKVLNGVGRALASGAMDAWFIDRLQDADPEIDIQPFLARAGTVSSFAIALSTLLGGVIASLFGSLPEEGSTVFTPIAMTIVAAVLVQTLNLVTVGAFVKEERPGTDTKQVAGLREVAGVVKEALSLSLNNPVLRLLLLATAVSGFAMASVETFWQPRFAELLGGSDGHRVLFGALMMGGFLAGMVGSLASIPVTRLLGKRYALVGAVFEGLGGGLLILLAAQGTVAGAAGVFWLFYFGRSVGASPLGKVQNDEIPKERRSSMLSVGSLVSYAGFFSGSAVLGFVADRASIGAAWTVAGVLLAASAFLYVRVGSVRTRRALGVKSSTD